MAFGTKVTFEAVREAAAAAIGATYTALGTATIDHTRILSLNNGTDAQVYVSFDGVTDHLRVASNSFKLFDFTANKVKDDGFFFAQGTIIYIRRVAGAPTTGSFWAEVAYASGGV